MNPEINYLRQHFENHDNVIDQYAEVRPLINELRLMFPDNQLENIERVLFAAVDIYTEDKFLDLISHIEMILQNLNMQQTASDFGLLKKKK